MQRSVQTPFVQRISLPCVLALLGAVSSCADDVRPVITVNENPSVILPSGDDACTDQDDGAPCAEDRLCVGGRCVLSTCGDGVQADDEACDDGNAAAGDGCSPACKLEYTLCPTGEYVLAGSECPEEVVDEAPPAVDGGASANCNTEGTIALVKVEGGRQVVLNDQTNRSAWGVLLGGSLKFTMVLPRGIEPKDGRFIWRSSSSTKTDDPERRWSYDLLASPSTANNTFTCPESTLSDHEVLCALVAPGCPPYKRSFLVSCRDQL